MVYKEVELALTLNSAYTQSVFSAMGPNVHIIRHGSLLWSHHDKIVVVDRVAAFVGGLDLCFGRFDDHKHTLTDDVDTPV